MGEVMEAEQAERKRQRLIYNAARTRAMRELAKNHPVEYDELLERHLGDLGYQPLWRRPRKVGT